MSKLNDETDKMLRRILGQLQKPGVDAEKIIDTLMVIYGRAEVRAKGHE